MKRRNLVVVRAGRTSLHGGWLELPYPERDFDLLVSYYDEDAFNAFQAEDGVRAVLVPGGKWDGLHRTLTGVDIEAYDYFWLPDDDIAATAADVNAIFDLCSRYGLAVAQPALTRDSYFSFFILSQCPGFRLRYTNFVEIMVPCLSREVLLRALPLFRNTMSGFGLDYIWHRWPESGAFRVAILDAVAVHHTRPVGKVLKAAMAAAGRLAPEVEELQLRERFGMGRAGIPLCFAGILDNGEPVTGRIGMAARMYRFWWKDRHTFRDRRDALRCMAKAARRNIVKPLDFSILEERS